MEGEKWRKRNVFFGSLCLHLHVGCWEQGKDTVDMIHIEEWTIDANRHQLFASCINLFPLFFFFLSVLDATTFHLHPRTQSNIQMNPTLDHEGFIITLKNISILFFTTFFTSWLHVKAKWTARKVEHADIHRKGNKIHHWVGPYRKFSIRE